MYMKIEYRYINGSFLNEATLAHNGNSLRNFVELSDSLC